MPKPSFFYKVTQNQNSMSHKYKYINRYTLDMNQTDKIYGIDYSTRRAETDYQLET